MIATIANIPVNPTQLAAWSWAHMAHHRDLNRRILEAFAIAVPEFVIDPTNPDDMGTWIDQHQQMHNNFNRILGLPGNDLLNVNWKDKAQLTSWIWLNFTEHLAASAQLGV